ncbi:50S ribosomal protein L22 [Candidatus Uhrbacteria bacterium]|nr:50S ribosomal protein L22 [Candidatus Uhrbacteria bacterium]
MIVKEVHAYARFLRISPRKVRLVVDVVRGLPAKEAETHLRFVSKISALPVLKLLQSAMANASHNYSLEPAGLFVKEITADGGPTLHRWRARAMGRAAPIQKRTTHLHIVLAPLPEEGERNRKGGRIVSKKKKSVVRQAQSVSPAPKAS